MDLLMEIKRFYDILVEAKIREKVPFSIIEEAAEDAYHSKWTTLESEIKMIYADTIVKALTNQLEVIKEIVKDEQKR